MQASDVDAPPRLKTIEPAQSQPCRSLFEQRQLMVCVKCTICPFAASNAAFSSRCKACAADTRPLSDDELDAGYPDVHGLFCCPRCAWHWIREKHPRGHEDSCALCDTLSTELFMAPYTLCEAWLGAREKCQKANLQCKFIHEVRAAVCRLEQAFDCNPEKLARDHGIRLASGGTCSEVGEAAIKEFLARNSKERLDRAERIFAVQSAEAKEEALRANGKCGFCPREALVHSMLPIFCKRGRHSVLACQACRDNNRAAVPLDKAGCRECRGG